MNNLIARIEIVKGSSKYFYIYHTDPVTGQLFKFGWLLRSALTEEDKKMKIGDDDVRQAREYLTHLIAKVGIQPFYSDNLWPIIDAACEDLNAHNCLRGYLDITRDRIEK